MELVADQIARLRLLQRTRIDRALELWPDNPLEAQLEASAIETARRLFGSTLVRPISDEPAS
jgi:hypothetical protein